MDSAPMQTMCFFGHEHLFAEIKLFTDVTIDRCKFLAFKASVTLITCANTRVSPLLYVRKYAAITILR